MKIIKTIVASVLVLGMGSAFAAEPLALTETQLDNVNAGGFAFASADVFAHGFLGAVSLTQTFSGVSVLQVLQTQGGQITQDRTLSISHAEGAAL
jgi:Flp pilus assembly protein CpaB